MAREPSSTRRGCGDWGQATPGFEPLSRAHLPSPTGAPPRPAGPLQWPREAAAGLVSSCCWEPGEAAWGPRAASLLELEWGPEFKSRGLRLYSKIKWVGVDPSAFATSVLS